MDLTQIGDAIRERRKKLRMTQPELAEQAGVSRARIAALETHKVSEIGLKRLTRVLNALGLDLRVTERNQSRPTLEDLAEEAEEEDG